ncbi:Glycoside hydrolase 2 (Mannanase, beta-galactosidase) [Sarracenia purpurea var. burkii]
MAMDSGSQEKSHKSHRSRNSGAKADKKKSKREVSAEQKHHNPKAFAFSSTVKAKRLQSRASEKEQRRLHVPTIDRSTGEPAPYVVVVQGPPKRRLQFVECPNDINGMIDAAKFADVALLLVDGSYGFEMETFEFLNILQNHGFPKIMGVLTHLDKFKDVKRLKKTKQRLKHRFWTEIYDGAKLFYLSGLIHGKYPIREVHNLARFISVMKFHPLSWRVNHPYILVDRFEDVTPPERVHIAGVGDYNLAGITSLVDPCPLPSAAKKKGLRDKEKLFYAPMSGLGDLLYDKDAVYININDHFVQFSKVDDDNGGETRKGKDRDVGEVLVKSLQNTKYSIDETLEKSFITLFGKKLNSLSEAPSDQQDAHNSVSQMSDVEPVEQNVPGELNTDDSDDEDESEGLDGSEISGEDKTLREDLTVNTMDNDSDEDNNYALERQSTSEKNFKEHIEFHHGRMRRKAVFGDDVDHDLMKDLGEDDCAEDEDTGDRSSSRSDFSDDGEDHDADEAEMGNASKWKESLAERTILRQNANLMQLVYGKGATTASTLDDEAQASSEDEESEDDEFFKPKGDGNKILSGIVNGDNVNVDDCSKFVNYANLQNWKKEELIASIRNYFVTGDWSKAATRGQSSQAIGGGGGGVDDDDDDDTVFGEFEDLETGEKYESQQKSNAKDDDAEIEERRLKKLALRAKFDAQYPSLE